VTNRPGHTIYSRVMNKNAFANFAPFRRVGTWVFDLDNTLYPAECNLFAQIDQRMSAFIGAMFGVGPEEARRIQKDYYYTYGTTLGGLMKLHQLPPDHFLDYVHDIDLTPVNESPALSAALGALPGRKFIFTNGTRRHAERVAEKLGVLHHFEDLFDITASGYTPKPQAEAYERFVAAHGVNARAAAMFEDLPHNLENPHHLGMATVLVHSAAAYRDHPSQEAVAAWREPPPHVHHVTGDLVGFLEQVLVAIAPAPLTKVPG
jgi:putative hydrolase of the HAD superfamily